MNKIFPQHQQSWYSILGGCVVGGTIPSPDWSHSECPWTKHRYLVVEPPSACRCPNNKVYRAELAAAWFVLKDCSCPEWQQQKQASRCSVTGFILIWITRFRPHKLHFSSILLLYWVMHYLKVPLKQRKARSITLTAENIYIWLLAFFNLANHTVESEYFQSQQD